MAALARRLMSTWINAVSSVFTALIVCRKDYWQATSEGPGRTLSEFITHGTESFRRPLRALAAQLAHRLLGSQHMTASLSMRRRSVLSMDGPQQQPSRKVMTLLRERMEPLMALLGLDQLAGTEQVTLMVVVGWWRSSAGCMPISWRGSLT